ncbi:MAG: hypothetical protein ACE5DX_00195 [Candidatus Dojkabacteria bacterium]
MYQQSQREVIGTLDSDSGRLVEGLLKLILLVVIFLLGGLAYKLANEGGVLPEQLSSGSRSSENVSAGGNSSSELSVEEAVEKIMLISTDETPTVATIVDSEKLKQANPDFYQNTLDGDQLLIYSNRAIIYRAQDGLIINVLPITRDDLKDSVTQVAGEETEALE